MSTRTDPWPPGTPCWVDLSVPDVAGAVAFYSAVVGWTFVDTGPEYGGYHIAQVDGRAAAGLGWLLRPTGIGPLRPVFDAAYRLFARNRKAISRALAPAIAVLRQRRERRSAS